MTKEEICRVHYLSCVEAYFGAWIGEKIPLGALYCESFLRWQEVLQAFSRDTTTYAAFSDIKRLQDLSEEVGLTTHVLTQSLITPDIYDAAALTLFAVKDSFFLGRKAWREDHYIAITRYTKKRIAYINQFPLEEVKSGTERLAADLSGQCLIYRLTGSYDKALFATKSERQAEKLKTPSEGSLPALSSAMHLRDAIGVLRVSRRRALDWLDWYVGAFGETELERIRGPVEEQIHAADRAYLQLHMYLVRMQQPNADLLASITEGLNEFEQKIK